MVSALLLMPVALGLPGTLRADDQQEVLTNQTVIEIKELIVQEIKN